MILGLFVGFLLCFAAGWVLTEYPALAALLFAAGFLIILNSA